MDADPFGSETTGGDETGDLIGMTNMTSTSYEQYDPKDIPGPSDHGRYEEMSFTRAKRQRKRISRKRNLTR